MPCVVSLPAVTSCTKKLPNSMSFIGAPPKSVARINDVRSSRGSWLATIGRELDPVHRHVDHRAVDGVGIRGRHDLGILTAGVALRHHVDRVPVFARAVP